MESPRSLPLRAYCLFFSACLATLLPAAGQTGYQFDLNRHSYSFKEPAGASNGETALHSLGAQAGMNYWFRLRQRRMEFIPGFHVGADIGRKNGFQTYAITNVQASLLFPILLYPLSFKDDCNCPTFRKQGTIIKKGLHFIIQPGLSVNRRNLTHDSISTSGTNITGVAGVGAGLDIGLSKTLTLTPFLLYQYFLNDKIKTDNSTEQDAGHQSIQLGMRMRIHQSRRKY